MARVASRIAVSAAFLFLAAGVASASPSLSASAARLDTAAYPDDGACLLQVNSEVRPSRARAPKQASLCVEGRLLPTLYVAGTWKSGTTQLFQYFKQAGVVNPCPFGFLHKECAFFNSGLNQAPGEAKEFWLSKLTPCPAAGSPKQVAGDFTPTYFNAVPAPAGVTKHGICDGSSIAHTWYAVYMRFQTWLWRMSVRPTAPSAISIAGYTAGGRALLCDNVDAHQSNAPRDMALAHGDSAKDITIVLLFREPLSRTQSNWYFGREFGFWFGSSLAVASFAEALNITAQHYLKGRVVEEILWASMYADHLEVWLQYFDAKQFVIVPNGYLSDIPKMTGFCEAVSDRLDFAMNCQDFGVLDTSGKEHEARANPSMHLPLWEEKAEAMAVFKDTIFPPLNARLFEMLASMHSQGATLSGYAGQGVEAWMTASW